MSADVGDDTPSVSNDPILVDVDVLVVVKEHGLIVITPTTTAYERLYQILSDLSDKTPLAYYSTVIGPGGNTVGAVTTPCFRVEASSMGLSGYNAQNLAKSLADKFAARNLKVMVRV